MFWDGALSYYSRSIFDLPTIFGHNLSRLIRIRPPTRQRRSSLNFGSLLISLMLMGCATLAQNTADGDVLQSWSGRFSLTITSPDATEQRNSGSFSLIERSNATELELSTPLGVTLASARIESGRATLRTADGKRIEASSGEDLTEQLFGWRIPVQRLPAWFKGKPARVTEYQTEGDRRDRPAAGEEDGWLIRYELWRTEGLGRVLISFPSRVSLRMVLNDH